MPAPTVLDRFKDPFELGGTGAQVGKAHAGGGMVGVEPGAIVVDNQDQLAGKRVEGNADVPGAGVPGDVGQGFLGGAEKSLVGAGRDKVRRRKSPDFELDGGRPVRSSSASHCLRMAAVRPLGSRGSARS